MAEAAFAWPGPPLVCPSCRRPPEAWLLDDRLCCSNPACATQHTLLTEAIPIVASSEVSGRIAAKDALGALPTGPDTARWLDSITPDTAGFGAVARAAVFLRALGPGGTTFYKDVCDALLPALPVGATVIDLGCGAGNLSFEVVGRRPASVVGLDLDAHLLRWAERAATGEEFEAPHRLDAGRFGTSRLQVEVSQGTSLRFVAGNLLDPPFEPATFDLATLVNVLDAVPFPDLALRQAVSLLKPGGYLLFASPDAWNTAVTPRERWLATDCRGSDRVFATAGLETVARIEDLEWRLEDAPRLYHVYRVHGRLLRRT